ncbi:MAG: MFS transporter, partial [Oscillospiraceae bacterium]|nr:MFS transporter [Oscillospiraceae bacterium]
MQNAQQHDFNAKLPFKVKLSYGFSGYCSFITWTIFSYYGLYFFTENVGLSAAFAGAMISLGTLWDAITDPLIGTLSDNSKNPKGRRRPLMKKIAIPFILVSLLLFTNWGFSEGVSKVYFVFIILAYYTCQTVVDISASSLGSEMTNDYDERSSLATYKNYFGLVPTVIVGLSLTLSTAFAAIFGPRFGWTGAVAVFMVIWAILMYFLYTNTEGYERPRAEGEEVQGFKAKDIVDLFKNKATRIVMMIFGLGILVNTINYSIQVLYYTEYVGLSDAQVAMATMAFGIASVICAYFCDIIIQKKDKKFAWIISVGSEGLVLILGVGLIVGYNSGSLAAIVIMMILMGLGNAAVYQVPWAMIPDCVDVNELASGKRTDGIIFGAVAFVQKACGAIGALI